MEVAAGPARYFFLRRTRGVREDVQNWPPEVKPLQIPDNQVCVAVFLYPEENGWRAEAVADEAAAQNAAEGAFVLTRQTTLSLVQGREPSSLALALLGVRVALAAGGKGPEYATHLVVRPGGGLGVPRRPLVVPIARMVLGAYAESGARAEAALDLRMTAAELAESPAYMPDALIEQQATRAIALTIASTRARHEIKPEVEAGRVVLYGKSELTATGQQARDALTHAPGVVEVSDRLLYGELLIDQVEQALAAKGLDHLNVLYEHGLIVLDGTVPDSKTYWTARTTALGIPGVRGVVPGTPSIAAPTAAATPEAPAATPAPEQPKQPKSESTAAR